VRAMIPFACHALRGAAVTQAGRIGMGNGYSGHSVVARVYIHGDFNTFDSACQCSQGAFPTYVSTTNDHTCSMEWP
jgi:hypothetical protein